MAGSRVAIFLRSMPRTQIAGHPAKWRMKTDRKSTAYSARNSSGWILIATSRFSFRVASPIDSSHSASGQKGQNGVATELAPNQRLRSIFSGNISDKLERPCFQKAPHAAVFRQQRLHFVPQSTIAATGLLQKRRALVRIALPRFMVTSRCLRKHEVVRIKNSGANVIFAGNSFAETWITKPTPATSLGS
jgi:hypothetical protein